MLGQSSICFLLQLFLSRSLNSDTNLSCVTCECTTTQNHLIFFWLPIPSIPHHFKITRTGWIHDKKTNAIQFVQKFQRSKNDSYLKLQMCDSLYFQYSQNPQRYSLLSHPLHAFAFYMKTNKTLQCTPCGRAQNPEA